MKIIVTFFIICFSLAAQAQDINFMISGAKSKKWVGADVYIENAAENPTTLTFYKNHTVVEYNSKYKNTQPVKTWEVVTGVYLNDNNISIRIGNRTYHAEFSKTNHGKDFVTLTYDSGNDNDALVIKTYYAE